ncbi:MAG: agmatinase [Acetivibrionales bacterium]
MNDLSLPRFMSCDASIEEAGIVIFGAGFDGTTSYRPGARFGPKAMRKEFDGLETYSPMLDMDLSEISVCDAGDLELPFGNTAAVLDIIHRTAAGFLEAGKKILMLGGEHLVTLPAFKAAIDKYPDLCLLHLDAHADLRDEYLGEKLSHSGVIRRIWEITGDGRIWQLGIRSGLREEFVWAREGHTFMRPFNLAGACEAAEALTGKPVYLSIDLDVLDPSVMPGTGTPEPGGVSFAELQEALLKFREMNIVAADVVELAPELDSTGISTAAACKVMREVLLMMGMKK